MTEKMLGSKQAYQRIHEVTPEKAQKMADRLLTGYVMWYDKMFARGIIGLVYGLWTLGLCVYNILQFTEATSGTFLITFILTIVELGVVVISSGILAYLVYRADEDKKRLRAIASTPGVTLSAKDHINSVRSRGNAVSDFDLVVGTGLFYVFTEFVLVLVFYVGTAFLNTNSAATPSILASTGADDLRFYIFAKIVYAFMLVKAAAVLGQAVKRAIADSFASLRLKAETLIDDVRMTDSGNDVKVNGGQSVSLSTYKGAAGLLNVV
jgi:hypothetical protein